MTLVSLGIDSQGALALSIGDASLFASFDAQDSATLESLIAGYDQETRLGRDAELAEIGRGLYRWLEGKFAWREGVVAPLLFEVTSESPTPADRLLLEAPWELLCDEDGFLAADQGLAYAPLRRVGARAQPRGPQPGALSVLFMAAAPRGENELNFEDEEGRILASTAAARLDLLIEETGTAVELGRRAAQLAGDGAHALHVLHLTCHGLNEPEPGLCLEDEVGELAWTPVGELVEALGETAGQLGLVFLSACLSAAGGGAARRADSLALALTRTGVRAVLGWAASVLDPSAIHFAATLYELLAGADGPLELAVAGARHALLTTEKQPDPHWHLARLFLGPDGGGCLAEVDGPRRKAGAIEPTFLDGDPRSKVAGPEEFVGRRRVLQDCVRALRGSQYAGVLLQGPGQNGKSSVAARLIDRFNELRAVVVRGRFDWVNLVAAIQGKFSDGAGDFVKAWQARYVGCESWKVGEALHELLVDDRTPPLLLVLDNFEDMLEGRKGAIHEVQSEVRELVAGIVRAFGQGQGQSRLLLTSRHNFNLPGDLGGALLLVPVASFNEQDATKRAYRAPAPAAGVDDLRFECAAACRRNPAVLALLLRRLVADPQGCKAVIEQIRGLEQAEQEIADEEFGELLANIAVPGLLKGLSASDRELFDRSMITEAPLSLEAVALLGGASPAVDGDGERLLSAAVWDELTDIGEDGGRAFMVTPLVRAVALRTSFSMPTDELVRELAGVLVPLLVARWGSIGDRVRDSAAMLAGSEVVRLARMIAQWQAAASFGRLDLAWQARQLEAEDARAHAKDLVEQLEQVGVEIEPMLYLDTSRLYEHGGEGEFRHRCIERALAAVEGVPLDELAVVQRGVLLFERAASHERRGAWDAAQADLRAVVGLLEAGGHERERAVAVGRIADILRARGELDEALRIRREEQLPVYERLGDIRELVVGRVNLALTLMHRERLDQDAQEIRTLLVLALGDAGRLRLRETTQIEALIRQLGQDPNAPPFA